MKLVSGDLLLHLATAFPGGQPGDTKQQDHGGEQYVLHGFTPGWNSSRTYS